MGVKPHPRIRKIVKWGGAIIAVVLTITIVASWRVTFSRSSNAKLSTSGVVIERGVLKIYRVNWADLPNDGTSPMGDDGLILPDGRRLPWSLKYGSTGRASFEHRLWIPAVVAALLSGFAWHLDTLATRRAREGKCPKCSYDRTGLAAAAPCPECGTTA